MRLDELSAIRRRDLARRIAGRDRDAERGAFGVQEFEMVIEVRYGAGDDFGEGFSTSFGMDSASGEVGFGQSAKDARRSSSIRREEVDRFFDGHRL